MAEPDGVPQEAWIRLGAVQEIVRTPFVVDLCKKNTAINSLDDETRVLEGSLYSPLRDDSCFSLVVVNPPLLPIPDEIPYPFV